jgi:hypothetical protein
MLICKVEFPEIPQLPFAILKPAIHFYFTTILETCIYFDMVPNALKLNYFLNLIKLESVDK